MAAFASTDDLSAFVGYTVDVTRGNAVLSMASAIIRNYTGCQLDSITGDVYLDQRGDNTILLPERPVNNVSAVKVLSSDGTTWITLSPSADNPDYSWDSHAGTVTIYNINQAISPVPTVQITYDHGYATIPDPIKQVCIYVASRLLANPNGVAAQSTGQVSVRYDRNSDLSLVEQRMLARYTTVEVS